MRGPFLGFFNGTRINNIRIMITGAANTKLALYSTQDVNITHSQ
jgi:hypothetical protein